MPFIICKTITETFLERVKANPQAIGFQFKPTNPEQGRLGAWKSVTYRQFSDECRLVSFGLMSFGVKPGDKVSILSNTRYEWSLCDMAILGAKAVTIPIYPSNTPDDVSYILNHSESKIVILEDAKQLLKILEKKRSNPRTAPLLEKIVVIDPSAMTVARQYVESAKDVITLQALKELGKREEVRDPTRFEQNLSSAKPDDLCTICYTSGTTGVPKGAMISHENVMSALEDALLVMEKHIGTEQHTTLSFLPFSHILGKVESFSVYPFGFKQAFAENLDKLLPNLKEIKPTLLFAVPRIFEKAYLRIQSTLDASTPSRRRLFARAMTVGKAYYDAIRAGKRPGLRVSAEYKLMRRLVFSKITAGLGGRLTYAISGGAPLAKEIGEFFQIVGVQVLEGYGLTETTAPVTLNTPDDIRFGTVGRPLPDVNIKIAEDGEILVRSKKVFKGYYKMPSETADALEGGWFHTGDIGVIDDKGFLRITDRKKDLIVTSGGKNVAPQKIENLAKTQKIINQFVVHGDNRQYLTALVTLDKERIIQYANENQILFSEYVELIKNPKIISLVQKTIDDLNQDLASFETIKKFALVPDEFSVESGEMTPSLKVKRSFVNLKYKQHFESMYK
jgi:long-chain acyl-CoA synthetase